MASKSKKILIIDDHKLFADGLALILNSMETNREIVVCNCAQSALSNLAELTSFDLILVDLHIPIFSGFAFLTAIKTQKLNVKVAVISGVEKRLEIERAIRLGAEGFIPKNTDASGLHTAIDKLLSGQRYLPEQWVGKIDWTRNNTKKRYEVDELTERQLQVLSLMQEGLKNSQIGITLGVSTSAIKRHIELLFKYFNVNNRTSCVQAAQDQGLL